MGQETNQTLRNQILDALSFTHHELFNLNLEEGVRCFSQSRESELIAFMNKKHPFFGSVFSNPMVKDLGDTANVPIGIARFEKLDHLKINIQKSANCYKFHCLLFLPVGLRHYKIKK